MEIVAIREQLFYLENKKTEENSKLYKKVILS